MNLPNLSENDLQKILGAVGLAYRARKAITGSDLCEDCVRSKKAKAVFIACDSSDNTKKKLKNACNTYDIPLIQLPISKEEFGSRLGKSGMISAVAVTDYSFIRIMEKTAVFTQLHD